jgi:hypothetical protein
VSSEVSDLRAVKPVAHELAHAVLHEDALPDRAIGELEAESVAHIVCSEFGIDSGAYSFGYLAGWAGEARRA